MFYLYINKTITTMKTTTKQLEVLSLLEQGWELGLDTYINKSWLQKNGLGHGGETVDVHSKTFNSLLEKNLIRNYTMGFPINEYWITNYGKEVLFINEIKNNGGRILQTNVVPNGVMYYYRNADSLVTDVETKIFIRQYL